MSSGLNKKISILVLAALLSIGLGGCKDKSDERLLSAINDEEVYGDKTGRYKSMTFFTQSYLSYTITNINLLPVDKSSLKFGVGAPGVNPALNKNHWGGGVSGDNFSWNTNWSTPKTFKVWWQIIFDEKKYSSSGLDDRYIIKDSEPGTAWCESIITINNPIPLDPRYFILHFYPDGNVDAYISASKEFDAEKSRVAYEDRMKLPVLKEKYCLKEIGNPYYGLPRPIPMY